MTNALNAILAQSQASALAQQGSRISGWVWVIIFILVALLVWWLLTRATTEEPDIHVEHGEHHAEEHIEEPAVETKAVHVEPEPPAPTPEPPAPPAAAEPPKPDDLTVLEGVGPKVNGLLQAAGISTFAQLAAADLAHLNKILDDAGYAYMDPASWPEQAKLLAEGRMEEFEQLTESLKGGRKVA